MAGFIEKNGQTLVIAVIGIVVMYLIAHSMGIGGLDTGGAGFSTISLTSVDFTSNDLALQGPAYLLGVSVDGGAESAMGTFTSIGDTKLSQPFTITANMTKNNCKYAIVDNQEILYKPEVREICRAGPNSAPTGASSCNPVQCPASSGGYSSQRIQMTAYSSSGQPTNIIYCLMMVPTARVGSIDTSAVYDWNVKVGVASGGSSAVADVNPITTNADLKIGNATIGRVKTIGSLMGSQSCPSASSNTITIRGINNETYNLANFVKYQYYRGKQMNVPAVSGSCLATNCQQLNTANAFVSEMDTLYKGLWVASSSVICKSETIVKGTGVSNATYNCVPTQSVAYPVLQFVVKADFLKASANVGIPKITYIGTDPIFETTYLKYPIKIKNDGVVTATFDVKVECAEGPVTLNRAIRGSYAAGEEKESFLEFQSMAGLYNCNVTAYDVNNPAAKDVMARSFTVQKQLCPSDFACCPASGTYQELPCPAQECETMQWQSGEAGDKFIETVCYPLYCGTNYLCERGPAERTIANLNCKACLPDERLNVLADNSTCVCIPSKYTACEANLDCPTGYTCANNICVKPNDPYFPTPPPPCTTCGKPTDWSQYALIIGAIVVIGAGAYLYFNMSGRKRR